MQKKDSLQELLKKNKSYRMLRIAIIVLAIFVVIWSFFMKGRGGEQQQEERSFVSIEIRCDDLSNNMELLTDKAMEDYYNDHKDTYSPSTVSACHILTTNKKLAQEIYQEAKNVKSKRAFEKIMDEYKGYYYTCLWGKVYKRCLFDNVVLPVGTIYEDEFVSFKVMYGCDSVAEVGRVLYGYRDNPTGIINSGFSIHRADRVASMEERMAFFAEHGEQELYEKARSNRDEFLGWLVENAKANGVYDELPERYRLMYEKRENGSTDHTG